MRVRLGAVERSPALAGPLYPRPQYAILGDPRAVKTSALPDLVQYDARSTTPVLTTPERIACGLPALRVVPRRYTSNDPPWVIPRGADYSRAAARPPPRTRRSSTLVSASNPPAALERSHAARYLRVRPISHTCVSSVGECAKPRRMKPQWGVWEAQS